MGSTRCGNLASTVYWVVLSLVVALSGCVSDRPVSEQVIPEQASPSPSISLIVSASELAVPTVESSLDIGGHVIFHRREKSGWFNIHILDLATDEDISITSGQGNNYDPAISPDGDLIIFISDRNQTAPYGNLWLMNSDGSGQRALVEQGEYMEIGPTWSPDGTKIAFQSNRQGGNPDIFIYDLESGELINFTQHPNIDANPAWSPDGTRIAFASDRSGNPEIWVAKVDGSSVQKLTDSPMLGEWRPAWSPGGEALVFESFPSVAPRNLYVQNLGDSQIHMIETFSVWNMWPFWVADDLLLYSASEDYNDDSHEGSPANLYLQNLGTGALRQLTSGPTEDGRPTWLP